MDAGIEPVTYFDSAAMIIGLILAGRWLEARAKAADQRRGRGARRASRRGRRAASRATPRATSPSTGPPGRPPARAARREGARRWRRDGGLLQRRRVHAHRRADAGRQGRSATRSSGPPSTRPAPSSCAPRRRAATACSARSCAWSAMRRAPRRPSSASPTGSSSGSCPSSSCWRRSTFVAWLAWGPEPALTHALVAAISGAHHRLPLRDGPGHADRGDGRDGPGRGARHPHPRRCGARARRSRRHASSSTRPARSPSAGPPSWPSGRWRACERGRAWRPWLPPPSAAPSIRSRSAIIAEADAAGLDHRRGRRVRGARRAGRAGHGRRAASSSAAPHSWSRRASTRAAWRRRRPEPPGEATSTPAAIADDGATSPSTARSLGAIDLDDPIKPGAAAAVRDLRRPGIERAPAQRRQ